MFNLTVTEWALVFVSALVISVPVTLVVVGVARGIGLFQSRGSELPHPEVEDEDEMRIRVILREHTRSKARSRRPTEPESTQPPKPLS